MKDKRSVVAIVGGGAAGLSAAVFLARAAVRCGLSLSVTVLEKAPRVGRKLLATGNGTCNITNLKADTPAMYFGADPAFAASALSAFSPREAMDFFASLGVLCKAREDGRVYPLCEQAAAVLDQLRAEAAMLGVETRCDAAVTAIRREKGGFVLTVNGERLYADRLIVAAGGAASPSLGGCTDGCTLLSALGHEKTPLFPAVTQIRADSPWLRAVKGLRVDATVSLSLGGKTVAASTGELLFTDYGLSGPAALAVSRAVGDWERQKRGEMTAHVDLLPDWDTAAVKAEVTRRCALAGRTMEDLLTGYLNKRIGQTVLRAAEVLPLGREAQTLTDREAAVVARIIKDWTFPVMGTKGFAAAQVTAGGIATAGFDPATMQSRRVAGLYAVGEVLDIDGACGGYNLQWAWSSAHAAAEHIVTEFLA